MKWEFVKIGNLWHALSRPDDHTTVCGIHILWFYPQRVGYRKVDGVCVSANIPDIACSECGAYTEKYVSKD